jgi:hypothetical protein
MLSRTQRHPGDRAHDGTDGSPDQHALQVRIVAPAVAVYGGADKAAADEAADAAENAPEDQQGATQGPPSSPAP